MLEVHGPAEVSESSLKKGIYMSNYVCSTPPPPQSVYVGVYVYLHDCFGWLVSMCMIANA